MVILFLIIFGLMLGDKVLAVEERSATCNRVFPVTTGTWLNEPPFWKTGPSCPVQSFGTNAARDCMRNRTFYVIGNSVPRQAAYGMLNLLGHRRVTRSTQKEECPSVAIDWGALCHREYFGVKIRYLYLAWVDGYDYSSRGGFPFHRRSAPANDTATATGGTDRTALNSTAYYFYPDNGLQIQKGDDSCHGNDLTVQECLRLFFLNATSSDVLLFSFGMTYVPIKPNNNKHQRGMSHTLWTWAEEEESALASINTKKWLASSTAGFRGHINRNFPGTVFRMTLAPVHNLDLLHL